LKNAHFFYSNFIDSKKQNKLLLFFCCIHVAISVDKINTFPKEREKLRTFLSSCLPPTSPKMPLLVAFANPNNLESFDESSIASLLSLDQLSSENLCSNSAIAIADKFIDSKGFPRRCKDLNSLIEKSFKWLAFSSLPNPKYSILHLEGFSSFFFFFSFFLLEHPLEFVKNRFHKHCIAVLNKELREGNIWTPEQCFEFYSIIIKTIKTELDVGFNKIADWPPKEFSSSIYYYYFPFKFILLFLL